MGEQAVALARKVGYHSAGTVEFLVDKHKKFYFLEMNTRLQVEHPITELVTGLDLVELMIIAASGQRLPITQSDVTIKGWAIESRVYAEDPLTFLPSIGQLSVYREPSISDLARAKVNTTSTVVRCDSGIVQGSEISMYYDPMICKLSTFGPNRQTAITAMISALDHYLINGVTHNIPLLRAILTDKAFLDGDITTNFLPLTFPHGFQGHPLTGEEKTLVLAASVMLHRLQQSVNGKISPKQVLYATLKDEETKMTLIQASMDTCSINDKPYALTSLHDDVLYSIMDIGSKKSCIVQTFPSSDPFTLNIRAFGSPYDVKLLTQEERTLASYLPPSKIMDHSKLVISPMPGSVLAIHVKAGQMVTPGMELMTIEAMKMQNVIRASQAGIIKTILPQLGTSVSTNDTLMEFE